MCNCPSCQNAGMSGVNGCGCSQPTQMNGLDGISADLTGAAVGAAVGALVAYFAGWPVATSAIVGAVANGVVIPSMTN